MPTVQLSHPVEYPQLEGASGRIAGYPTEEDGVTVIPNGTLTALALTLFVDDGNDTIINSRNAQDILNANGGVIEADGRIVFTLAPADNPIVDAALPFERHIALFEWTWGSGKAGKFQLILVVRNLQQVP